MELEPRLCDEGGYEIVAEDLLFLGIARDSFAHWARREAPLKISPADYNELRKTLAEALAADSLADADVRLQGSSARFFSSAVKPMLYKRGELADHFIAQYGRLPTKYEVDRMMANLAIRWTSPGPVRRPYDALFVIGAAREGSDLDFQVSSDDARRRLEAAAEDIGISLVDIRSVNEKYNFFVKELTESVFTHLSLWRTRATELVRRPVSVAVFSATGPPDTGEVASSHFKPSDWMVELDA
jgi:hypothetical protein